MKNPINPRMSHTKLSLGLLSLVGGSLALTQAATAAPVSLLNPVIGGTAPNNFNLRCSVPAALPLTGNSVINCPNGTTLETVLMGGPGSPGGHVELNSITFGQPNLFTSLQGTLNGNAFSARSLMTSDWVNLDNTPTDFTNEFLAFALQTNGFLPTFFEPINFSLLTNTFIDRGGPARFSDPNIAYVSADDVTNDLTLGLAGIWNASDLLTALFDGVVDPSLIPDVVQVSEAVYIDYGSTSGYFYSTGGALPGTTDGPFFVDSSGQSVAEGFPCLGGAISGVLDPRAGCSYTADFPISSVSGSSPEGSILPDPENVDPVTGAVDFVNAPILQDPALTWFDPPAVTAFEFVSSDPGTLFASIMLLPRLGSGPGSNEYDIFLGDGGSCNSFNTFLGKATGGVQFSFGSPVECFAIGGIDAGLGLTADRYDPNNPNPDGVPFPVGLTFFGDPETVNFTQTPVPEPLTLLGASAAIGFGGIFKRRRSANSRKG